MEQSFTFTSYSLEDLKELAIIDCSVSLAQKSLAAVAVCVMLLRSFRIVIGLA